MSTSAALQRGYVDSASVYEALLLFTRSKADHSYRMEFERALSVTALLINADAIRLAPSPRVEGGTIGSYSIFLQRLADVVSRIRLPPETAKSALTKTRRWAKANRSILRKTLSEFAVEESDYGRWLETHINHEWSEHAIRHGALFDHAFLPEIADALSVSNRDLESVRKLTSEPSTISQWVRHRPNTEAFQLARDAFVVSTLLRGRYHEDAAMDAGVHLASHPIRRPVWRKAHQGTAISLPITNTQQYLASIAVASAFCEAKHEQRVELWIQNIMKFREAKRYFNLAEQDSDEAAREIAVDAARRYGIRAHRRHLEILVDAGIALNAAAFASFILSPWTGFAFASTVYVADKLKPLGKGAVEMATKSRWNLRRLTRLAPGRIEG